MLMIFAFEEHGALAWYVSTENGGNSLFCKFRTAQKPIRERQAKMKRYFALHKNSKAKSKMAIEADIYTGE